MGKYKLYDLERDRTLEFELTPSQFEELKGFLKGLKKPPELDYKLVLERFNAICRNLPPATRLTDKRRRAIAKLVKEKFDLEEIFRKAAESAFLNGNNKQGWRASLDWLLIPSNALKVMEGHYDILTAAQPLCAPSFKDSEVMVDILSKYNRKEDQNER